MKSMKGAKNASLKRGRDMASTSDFDPAEYVDFLENHPLYTWKCMTFPQRINNLEESRIIMYCKNCRKDRTFQIYGTNTSIIDSMYFDSRYICTHCRRDYHRFYMQIIDDEEGSKIRKVGQSPPISTKIDNEIRDFLGEKNTDLYIHGKRSEIYGYGIGAFVYYRRIIENKINDLLGIMRSIVDKPAKIEKAIKQKRMEDKIQIIQNDLPEILHVDGSNPLKLLYELLSDGIHGKTDQECAEDAKVIRKAFDFLIKSMDSLRRQKAEYSSAIKELEQKRESRSGLDNRPKQ